jgi:hypothetical protein
MRKRGRASKTRVLAFDPFLEPKVPAKRTRALSPSPQHAWRANRSQSTSSPRRGLPCDLVLKGRQLKAWGKVRIANETPGYLPACIQSSEGAQLGYVVRPAKRMVGYYLLRAVR